MCCSIGTVADISIGISIDVGSICRLRVGDRYSWIVYLVNVVLVNSILSLVKENDGYTEVVNDIDLVSLRQNKMMNSLILVEW